MHASPLPLVSLLTLLAPAADGWLGVYLVTERTEAVVAEVIPDSPAAKAGLQAGDVLLAVGERTVATREEFMAAIRGSKAGQRVQIRYRRQQQEATVVVKLGERPDSAGQPGGAAAPGRPSSPPSPASAPVVEVAPAPPSPPAKPVPPAPAARPAKPYLGLSVVETDDGVQVERVLADSPAAKAGVREGERVVAFGDIAIESLADLDRALASAKVGDTAALTLRRGDGVRTLQVALVARQGRQATAAPARVESTPAAPPSRPAAPAAAPDDSDDERAVQEELDKLRRELRELRQQVEELRRLRGRE